MNVDLEAIAQRGRCDVTSLRTALPLLQQGYLPPFLARYRRDELGGLDESGLWALWAAVQAEQAVADRRDELSAVWETTPLKDPAIGHAIGKSNSARLLERLGRRLKLESHNQSGDSARLAVRIMNPEKGDGSDFAEIAAKVEGIQSPENAVAGLDEALAVRLAGDPRIIGAAVRWLGKNARIHIAGIHDPHAAAANAKTSGAKNANVEKPSVEKPSIEKPSIEKPSVEKPSVEKIDAEKTGSGKPAAEEIDVEKADAAKTDTVKTGAENVEAGNPETADADGTSEPAEPTTSSTPADTPTPPADAPTPPADAPGEEVAATDSPSESPPASPAGPSAADPSPAVQGESSAGDVGESGPGDAKPAVTPASEKKASAAKKPGSAASAPTSTTKKSKKVSPRQRRRRWLVSVLKPLEGKRIASGKLSSFQVVMIGRALRSQVASCSFEYDAAKLVNELQRAAGGINRQLQQKLVEIVLQNEADIREAAEGAWWDELQERASTRLVGIAADNLRRQIDRGGVEAKVVMSIDAVGPRTAATTIVAADGRLLHSEDLPCQLSAAPRSQAVARMGELIHAHHVDLIVISNGPARRACMVAMSDLINQSPSKSLRWTLADRSGADAYAGSPVADQEMKMTPRRFRSAAWLAFSVLLPAQALAKIDPLKLRLGSFQRELSDGALLSTLEDVMVSGASRGGVDINAAPVSWLARLPGVSAEVAEAIDSKRRESLLTSRDAVRELEAWVSDVGRRQALPFLRVFGSEEVLDGTLIHPDDYPLAKKLATALEIELPPAAPPGYVAPEFGGSPDPAETPAPQSAGDSDGVEIPDQPNQDSATSFDLTAATAEQAGAAEGTLASEEPPAGETTSPDEPSPSEQVMVERDPPAGQPSAEADATAEGVTDGDASPSDTETGDTETGDTETGDSATGDSATGEAAVEAAAPPAVDVPEPIRRPRPEGVKVDKCIKEWQIGSRRAHQLVHWLCDPFGDSGATGRPPAVLSAMPSLSNLKQGDEVIGVIVGVMPFGVFVELAPDCSGLIHVSKVSDGFVEDLHEAVQVGDVVTAWVTGVDEKRRRVALSAASPEREAELQQIRSQRDSRDGGRGRPSHGGRPAQGGRSAQGGQARGGQARGDQQRGRQGAPSKGSQAGAPRRGGGGGNRGGRGDTQSRDGHGGRRGQGKNPETYRVASRGPAKPITDAMQTGDEPMRTFGDLMQFYTEDEKKPPTPPIAKDPVASDSVTGDTVTGDTAPQSDTDSAAPLPPTKSTPVVASGPSESPPTIAEPAPAESAVPSSDVSASPANEPSSPVESTAGEDRASEKSDNDGGLPSSTNEPPAPSDTPPS